MKGFVLINTVFNILIISLISMTFMNRLNVDSKLVVSLLAAQQDYIALEDTALRFINANITPSSKYNYINTDLGEFDCLQIYKDEASYSSQHWLLRILNKDNPGAILQIRYITIGKLANCKQELVREVKVGISSWLSS